MKKLPLAITTFAKIRDKSQNYLYVDKTEFACQLIDKGEYYFLSRPRRFGKSLFIDTLSVKPGQPIDLKFKIVEPFGMDVLNSIGFASKNHSLSDIRHPNNIENKSN